MNANNSLISNNSTSICNISSRSIHIDIIKGWAMLTIVIFHCSSSIFNDMAQQFMGNHWNVAVFFIVGGFFLDINKLSRPRPFLLKKLKTLYIPATTIYLLAVLLHNVFVCLGWYPLGELHPGNGQPFQFYSNKDFIIGCSKVLCCGGSGELIMGAMWFLYALIYSFVGLALLWWMVNKVSHLICTQDRNRTTSFNLMTVGLLLLALISCVLTQNFHITISRFSTSLTAMFLIWVGMIINKHLCWKYDNHWMFDGCLLVFIQCVLLNKVGITMANNQYQDLVQLVVGSCSLIYIWGFIGKKISTSVIGKFLALIGRESLYVMALHIMGFFMCNSLLKAIGVYTSDTPRGMYTYNMDGNLCIFLLYMVFGIGVPLILIYAFRRIRSMVLCLTKKDGKPS